MLKTRCFSLNLRHANFANHGVSSLGVGVAVVFLYSESEFYEYFFRDNLGKIMYLINVQHGFRMPPVICLFPI